MFRNVYLPSRSWRRRGKRFFPSAMTLWVHSGRELKINWDQRISLWRLDVATGKWNAKSAGGVSRGALPPPLLPLTAGSRLKLDGQGQPEECWCNDITGRHISASILPVTLPLSPFPSPAAVSLEGNYNIHDNDSNRSAGADCGSQYIIFRGN